MSADDLLKRLHEKLLQKLLDRLDAGEDVKPADLEVARKFLADNGIDADAMRNPGMGQLTKSVVDNLPFTDTAH